MITGALLFLWKGNGAAAVRETGWWYQLGNAQLKVQGSLPEFQLTVSMVQFGQLILWVLLCAMMEFLPHSCATAQVVLWQLLTVSLRFNPGWLYERFMMKRHRSRFFHISLCPLLIAISPFFHIHVSVPQWSSTSHLQYRSLGFHLWPGTWLVTQ
jgi:hypothetical protein